MPYDNLRYSVLSALTQRAMNVGDAGPQAVVLVIIEPGEPRGEKT